MNWKNKLGLGLLVLFVVVFAWFWDSTPPEIQIESLAYVNQDSMIQIITSDSTRGLRSVQIALKQGDRSKSVSSENWTWVFLPWQSSEMEHTVLIQLEDYVGDLINEGPFQVEVTAEDQPNLGIFSRSVTQVQSLELDTQPPEISPLTGEHYLRQGGCEAIVYRVSETASSGVQVGENRFTGYPLPSGEEGTYFALFAMTHIQTLDVSISLWATDRAGNKSHSKFWCRTSPGRFRSRRINITDRFINKVAPEILSKTTEIQEKPSLLETFLEINRTLRVKNNQKITELTQVSQPELLWNEPFIQLSNSSVEANFADFRRYYYQNKPIDEQTHLGFDLASTAQSPVEASNRGRVVFAQYLGIYGNTVIIDHGLGLFSLYGHLSSIGVQPDEIVERGQSLGRTGQSGLAGGDHLHFSIILQGIQVNPIEWWDRNWVQNRILQKYRVF